MTSAYVDIRRPALLIVLVYAGFFVWVSGFPVLNETGRPTSPLILSGTDIKYYLIAAGAWSETSWSELVGVLYLYYSSISLAELRDQGVLATIAQIRSETSFRMEYLKTGPLYPFVLNIMNYSAGTTLPLALSYLILGIGTCFAWLWWLWENGVRSIPLYLFCLLPAPLYFSVSVGTDLPFLSLMALFVLTYFRAEWRVVHIIGWVAAIVMMAMLRPNGVSLIAFVLLDLLVRRSEIERGIKVALLAIVFCLGLGSLLFYFPHGLSTVGDASVLVYFGIPTSNYATGVLGLQTVWVDQVLSTLLLVGAKILYLVGLRPSFADASTMVVLIRAAPGLIFLPGLIWGLMSGWRSAALVVIFAFPIMIGPTQDRYFLALQPLLFFWALCFWQKFVTSRLGDSIATGSLLRVIGPVRKIGRTVQ
jgi:hypothetical protein